MKSQDFLSNHIHFIGVGGIGMSAIADVLLDMGCVISGSDEKESQQVTRLIEKGAQIVIGQSAENITSNIDLVVHSTAIRPENPERAAAEKNNIPVWHRSEMLGALMADRRAICIAGSHGKTTTSSMVSLILEKNNYDPTIVVGGIIQEIGSNAKYGHSDLLVAEADESDGSFVNLLPWVSVITNIEEDHLDHFKDITEISRSFATFIEKTKPDGLTILCADCDEAMKMRAFSKAPVVTYGVSDQADYQVKNHRQVGPHNEGDIYHKGALLGHLVLKIPGIHNVLNATAAVITGLHLGLTFEQIAPVLASYGGTMRRFQHQGTVRDIQVFDDYAHHPTEIRATIRAAKDFHNDKPVVAVFQPHRYSRTQSLAKAFAESLALADKVYLLDVYPAGEDPIAGVSSQLIVDALPHDMNSCILSEEVLPEKMVDVLMPGDLVLVLGAGSIWQQAPKIVDALKRKYEK